MSVRVFLNAISGEFVCVENEMEAVVGGVYATEHYVNKESTVTCRRRFPKMAGAFEKYYPGLKDLGAHDTDLAYEYLELLAKK